MKSPLQSASPESVSVCGKMLRSGQSCVVPASAVGPREKAMELKGKIKIRSSNVPGQVQILCTL